MAARVKAIVIGTAAVVAVGLGAVALIDSDGKSSDPTQKRQAVTPTQPATPLPSAIAEPHRVPPTTTEGQRAAIEAQLEKYREVQARIQAELDAQTKG